MKFTESQSSLESSSYVSYNGLFTVSHLAETAVRRIKACAITYGLSLDIGESYIEFRYEGRDSNRFIVRFLQDLAENIGTASGELRCEISREDGDPLFEFFQIRDFRLVRQRAHIVRDAEEYIEQSLL